MNRKRGRSDRCTNKDSLKELSLSFDGLFSLSKKRFFPSSRGQLTIFIIVGIVMLFTFAGILLVTRNTAETRISASGEPVITAAPQEFQGVQAFTETCLMDQGKKALVILGKQGGYINPTTMGEFSETDPTNSLGLDLGSLQVPYWQYNSEKNEKEVVSLSSLRPLLYYEDDPSMSVEAQLARQVQAEIKGCLDNYDNFKTEGFIVVMAEPEVEVSVSDVGVNFWLTMDVEADKAGSKHKFEQFYVSVALELKRYYELASLITEVEQNYTFLERQALELIQIFSGVDEERLPPTDDFTFELAPTIFWSADEVEHDVQDLLVSYVPLIQYLTSDNFDYFEFPASVAQRDVAQRSYDNLIIPFDGGQGLQINFDYFDWPIYFHTNADGDLITPQSIMLVDQDLLHLNMQRYYTVYDISHPVLVTIHDNAAFDGEGYDFVFALESNVRNNEPASSDRPQVTIPADALESMVCDEDKFSVGPLRIVVVNSADTSDLLGGVQIGYSIPYENTCILGVTNRNGQLDNSYPAAYGGMVTFVKEGFLSSFYPLDTYPLRDTAGAQSSQSGQPLLIGYAIAATSSAVPERVIEMHPFKKIPITATKVNLKKCSDDECYGAGILFSSGNVVYDYNRKTSDKTHYSWVNTGRPTRLNENEEAVITLTRVRDLNADEGIFNNEFTTTAVIHGSQPFEVDLVPGVYRVSTTLILNEEVVIPEEEQCFDAFIFDECVTVDAVTMGSFVSGNIEWDTKDTYFVVTADKLYGATGLEFRIPNIDITSVPPLPGIRIIDDLELMNKITTISNTLRDELEPKFK